MRLLEFLREGGVFAFLAAVLGVFGTVVGVGAAALRVGNRRAASTVGMVALAFAILGAGAGLAGTVMGKQVTEKSIANVNVVQGDQLRRKGYAEAQGASLVGFVAALAPLLLGAFATLARGSGGTAPRVAVVVAGLTASGALVQSRLPLPEGTYHFAETDTDAWDLAAAMDMVGRSRDPWVCPNLEKALERYWQPVDRAEWPRTLRRTPPPELGGWKRAADTCAAAQLAALAERVRVLQAPPEPGKVSGKAVDVLLHSGEPSPNEVVMALMQSVLLQDEAHRVKLMAIAEDLVPDAPPGLPTPADGPPEAVRQAISSVVFAHSSALRACYEAGLAAHPGLAGVLLVRIEIAERGEVTSATDASPAAFPDARVTTCVLELVRRMKFPPGVGPGTVEYPFDFSPG